MNSKISSRQLEAFRATVTLGNASAAALAMHITQPAISHLLRDLEIALGFQVLQRKGRGLMLTQQGQMIFQEVQRSYIGLESIQMKARLIKEGKVNTLRIATMPAFAETYVAPALGILLRAMPELSIELDVLNTRAVIEGVTNRRFDLGIAMPLASSTVLNWVEVHSSRMVVVMHAKNRFAKLRSLKKSHLLESEMISLPMDSPYRLQLEAAFAESGQYLPIRHVVRTQAAACELILHAAQGVSVVESSIANRYKGLLLSKALDVNLTSTVAICSIEPVRSELHAQLKKSLLQVVKSN